jgi:hypothetical protein
MQFIPRKKKEKDNKVCISSPPRPSRLRDPSSLLSNGYGGGAFFMGVKASVGESDCSPSSSAQV